MAVRSTLLQAKRRFIGLLGAGGVLLWAGASTASAQIMEVRPIADLSTPTKVSLRDGSLRLSQKVGVSFGARMTLTFNDRFDVTSTVRYSPGYATLYGSGKRIQLLSGAQTLGASSGARYWLRSPGGPFSWEVHTGLGLIFGGQPAYEELFESSTLTAVLGTALRYQVGRIASLTLRIQERLLRLRFGQELAGSPGRPLRVTVGVGLPILEVLRNRVIGKRSEAKDER